MSCQPFRDFSKDADPGLGAPRNGFTLVELLVVIAIIGILIDQLLPAVQTKRELNNRSFARVQLRKIAVATLDYQTENQQLPESYDELLPYLDQDDLHDRIEHGYQYFLRIRNATKDANLPAGLDIIGEPVVPGVTGSMTQILHFPSDQITEYEAPEGESNRQEMFDDLHILWRTTRADLVALGLEGLDNCAVHDREGLGPQEIFTWIANEDGAAGVSLQDLIQFEEVTNIYANVVRTALYDIMQIGLHGDEDANVFPAIQFEDLEGLSSALCVNFDVRPRERGNRVDSLDLTEWIRRIRIGADPGQILFDFSRFWQSPGQ